MFIDNAHQPGIHMTYGFFLGIHGFIW
jgi:hypothetical protein